jgi:hypothetical protein
MEPDLLKLLCTFMLIFIINFITTTSIQVFTTDNLSGSSMFFAILIGTMLGMMASVFAFIEL